MMRILSKTVLIAFVSLISFDVTCNAGLQRMLNGKSGRKINHRSPDCNRMVRNLSDYHTVEDFDQYAPCLLPDYAREYYLAAAKRRVTYRENIMAYRRLQILPKMLRDVSNICLEVTALGFRIRLPIFASLVALQGLASDLGEIDTVRAISEAGGVMVLSSFSGTTIEDVARAARARGTILWMQTYLFPKREVTIDIIRRAEASGFRAVIVTVDVPTESSIPSRFTIIPNPKNLTYVNLEMLKGDKDGGNPKLTFKDIEWLKKQTRLPIIAKGILTADDAVLAARHGASAILVSNHGGRQLDYEQGTIDALPSIVDAIQKFNPRVEVYVDGGVRNGIDVFKALAYGARLVGIGRPIVWGLAVQGQKGVSKVLSILKNELNETMTLAGTPNVDSIERKMVISTNRNL